MRRLAMPALGGKRGAGPGLEIEGWIKRAEPLNSNVILNGVKDLIFGSKRNGILVDPLRLIHPRNDGVYRIVCLIFQHELSEAWRLK